MEVNPPAFWKVVAGVAVFHAVVLGALLRWSLAPVDHSVPRVAWISIAPPSPPQGPRMERPGDATGPRRSRPARNHVPNPEEQAAGKVASPVPASSDEDPGTPSPAAMEPKTGDATGATDEAAASGSGSDSASPPASTEADYQSNPAPVYPLASRLLGEEGQVLVWVLVDTAGLPDEVRLARPSGFSRLDGSAISAVKAWKFKPARRQDRAVAGWVTVPVRFSLRKG